MRAAALVALAIAAGARDRQWQPRRQQNPWGDRV